MLRIVCVIGIKAMAHMSFLVVREMLGSPDACGAVFP